MTIIETLIAIGYLIILILCVTIALRGNSAISSDRMLSHRIIFFSITIILLVMIFLRLLDINDYLTEEIRIVTRSEGWYGGRRTFQMFFVSGVIISGIISLILLERKLDIVWQYYSMTLYGIIFLISFMIINIVSYHPIDQLLQKELGDIRYNRIIESLNITWIIISLFGSYRRSHPKAKGLKVISGSRYI